MPRAFESRQCRPPRSISSSNLSTENNAPLRLLAPFSLLSAPEIGISSAFELPAAAASVFAVAARTIVFLPSIIDARVLNRGISVYSIPSAFNNPTFKQSLRGTLHVECSPFWSASSSTMSTFLFSAFRLFGFSVMSKRQ
jgi:hypothetical protein